MEPIKPLAIVAIFSIVRSLATKLQQIDVMLRPPRRQENARLLRYDPMNPQQAKRLQITLTTLFVVITSGVAIEHIFDSARHDHLQVLVNFQRHPIASILGALASSIIWGSLAYWMFGRIVLRIGARLKRCEHCSSTISSDAKVRSHRGRGGVGASEWVAGTQSAFLRDLCRFSVSARQLLKTNLTRGLFRLWILASTFWVVGWLWNVRASCIELIPITASEASTQYVKLCYTSFSGLRTPARDFGLWEYASIGAIAIGVPVAVLALGFAVFWVAHGFRRQLPPQPK